MTRYTAKEAKLQGLIFYAFVIILSFSIAIGNIYYLTKMRHDPIMARMLYPQSLDNYK